MNEIIKFALKEFPELSSCLIFLVLITALIGLPIGMIIWLLKTISKERYVFAQNEYLYCLDTYTGKIKVARGLAFQEIETWGADKKINQFKAKAPKSKSEKEL